MTEQEKTLIARCVKGEKAAWDAFVRQYSGLIYHTIRKTFALHHTEPRMEIVDDLFQDIFLSLVNNEFAQLRRFRGDNGCTLASWLRMIAARRTIDHLRNANIQSESLADHFVNATNVEPDPVVDQHDAERIAQAVANLQPRERIIIDLFFRRNLSAEDVAGILRMSVGAVYTQKSRILAKLRETLEK